MKMFKWLAGLCVITSLLLATSVQAGNSTRNNSGYNQQRYYQPPVYNRGYCQPYRYYRPYCRGTSVIYQSPYSYPYGFYSPPAVIYYYRQPIWYYFEGQWYCR